MSTNEEKIDKLTRENESLRREVDQLKSELERINGRSPLFTRKDKYSEEFEKRSRSETLYSKKSYTAYLFSHISQTSIFHLYKRMISYARRYALISTTIKAVLIIVAILQTSTFFVLATSLFVVSLPFTFIIGYAAILISLLGSKKQTKKIVSLAGEKDIVILAPQRGRAFDKSSYFRGMAYDIAKDKSKLVIIISPYFFSSKGIGNTRRAFFMSRQESENIVLVRRHFYFTLKRKAKKLDKKRITVIY